MGIRVPIRLARHFFWGAGGLVTWAALITLAFEAWFPHVALSGWPLSVVQAIDPVTDWLATTAPTLAFIAGGGIALVRTTQEETQRAHPTTTPVPALATALALELASHTFQAEKATYERRGTVLSIRCTNVSPNDSVRECRARLEEISQQQEDGSWVLPPNSGFKSHWLTWDRGGAVATLAPTDWADCLILGHDPEVASFVHLVTFSTEHPWIVRDGRWRVTITWRADDHLPFTSQFEFESQGNEDFATPAPDRVLRWID
jgi:hypothetical protein